MLYVGLSRLVNLIFEIMYLSKQTNISIQYFTLSLKVTSQVPANVSIQSNVRGRLTFPVRRKERAFLIFNMMLSDF